MQDDQIIVRLHPHAASRLLLRGTTEEEVRSTVLRGETFPVKYGRTGFRRNFHFNSAWRGKIYSTKQVEAYAVMENGEWLVITVVTRFF